MTTSLTQPVILQIIPELGPGGAEQGCIDVGAAIVKNGARAIIVSHGGDRLPELKRHAITHIDMQVHSKNPLIMALNIWRLKRLIRKHGVNIVHVRSRAPAWSAYFACKNTPARFMTTVHAPYNISGDWKRRYNSVMTKGERVIAISHMVQRYIHQHYPDTAPDAVRLIHRGIAMNAFHPEAVTPQRVIALSGEWRIPDCSNIVLLPGRLTRWKGHDTLIDAAHIISEARAQDDLFFVIIGSDQGRKAYRQELETRITDKALDGRVRIIDHCPDMPAAYMLASVVVSASLEPEGFGRVPVEAQAMGRPIVATDHGGAQETIRRGETGWLVPPGDAHVMADAIQEALALSPDQRALLAERAMTHAAAHFSTQAMTEKTLGVYQELLS